MVFAALIGPRLSLLSLLLLGNACLAGTSGTEDLPGSSMLENPTLPQQTGTPPSDPAEPVAPTEVPVPAAPSASGVSPPAVAADGYTFALDTINQLPLSHPASSGRHGYFLVPKLRPAAGPATLLLLHGFDGSGQYMVNMFADAAKKQGIVLLAPDSANKQWETPTAGTPTDDSRYVATCLQWLQAHVAGRDSSRVGAMGHSYGTRMAAAVGTQNSVYSALMLAHGRYEPETLGTHILPVWFSGSPGDKSFKFAVMREQAQAGQPLTQGRPFVLRTFTGDPNGAQHLPTPEEVDAMVSWFLAHPSG